MLTCLGDGYAGRVGASLLSAVGLDELITDSPEAYARSSQTCWMTEHLRQLSGSARRPRRCFPVRYGAGFTRAWEDLRWQPMLAFARRQTP